MRPVIESGHHSTLIDVVSLLKRPNEIMLHDTAEPVHIWNPMGFDPCSFLPPELHRHSDCVRYILHRIYWAGILDRRLRGEFIHLKANILRGMFPTSQAYKLCREALISSGTVVCDGHYHVGEKSFGYKLGPELAARPHHRIFITNRTLTRKIVKAREDWSIMPMQVHRHLYKQLSRIKIDFDGALAELKMSDNYCPYEVTALELIRDEVWRCKVCEYGRVHSNLTNLRSSLRPYLSVDGQSLVNLDIANSQPLLFALLLRDHFGTRPPADVRRYIELVEQGQFYDHLMAKAGLPASGRSAFKESFFASVFFCKNFPIKPQARLFGDEFPNVFSYILHEKMLDHADLARQLQRNESEIIIRRICSRVATLLPKAFIGTIHDSLLVKPEDAPDILGIMRHEFSLDGLSPTIRVEVLQHRLTPKSLTL